MSRTDICCIICRVFRLKSSIELFSEVNASLLNVSSFSLSFTLLEQDSD